MSQEDIRVSNRDLRQKSDQREDQCAPPSTPSDNSSRQGCTSPRILITRLSAIGDCILTLPLACAVRAHFPHAFLAWTIEPAAAKLIGQHRAVDEFIVVPKGWFKSYQRIRAFRTQLQTKKFDYVLDPQSLTKSSLLGRLSGAPRRIGFTSPRGRELAPWLNNECLDVGQGHLVDATLRLLEPLGVCEPSVRFDVPVEPRLETETGRYIGEAHLSHGYAVINCAASCPARVWPADRFGRVARHLGERYGLTSVVTWAGTKEEDMANRVVAKSGGHAILAPQTSLPELAAIQRHARLMIGSDTGPLHLAAAVGTPCLGLYGPTPPERSGPYGAQHRVVESSLPRSHSHRHRHLDDSAMRQISVEQVCAACDDMLSDLPAREDFRSDAA